MRSYSEPTARNLLRRPLVLGVPLVGLVLLAFGVLTVFLLAGSSALGNGVAGLLAVVGYAGLRLSVRFAKTGWEEAVIFKLECWTGCDTVTTKFTLSPSVIELMPPDTLDEAGLLYQKDSLMERLLALQPGGRLALICESDMQGSKLTEISCGSKPGVDASADIFRSSRGLFAKSDHIYSLYQLPVMTDPLWLFSILSKIKAPIRIFVSIKGVDFSEIKRRIEVSRRSNSQLGLDAVDMDARVTFEEASDVLKGLSRGDEAVVELSLVIASQIPLDLDQSLFCEEKNHFLAIASILGLRSRYYRSHFVRAVTATDLIPNILDPKEDGPSILTTLRGLPLYFSPQDGRLEALHWLVVGASGSGKSFFTGLVLKRMVEQGSPMSVLFVDHNRSFRRLIRNLGGKYCEPKTLDDLTADSSELFKHLNQVGTTVGIELSDLDLDEKKGAVHLLLSKIETFLRLRDTSHPVYIVLDECWNFLRDNPLLVQRAFREFRKLNGAVIAITQSLFDFLTDESGQSIFQNAPVRILLRQGEDLSRYQGALALNAVELTRVRMLRQQKGVFSECLIKTPFLSRIGRLYPTEEEHRLLRTDNLRAELIAEAKSCITLGALT